MSFWDKQADHLEQKLLQNMPALMLHFLQTASEEQIIKITSDGLPMSDNTRSSIIAHLTMRLAEQSDSIEPVISPETARAIQANCHTTIEV